MRRTVEGGLWKEREGGAALADRAWATAGMIRTGTTGSVAAAHAFFSVATVVGAVSA